jgi:undecaprenyl diphosphate synthase
MPDSTPTPQTVMTPAADSLPAPLPRHIAIIMDGNGRWAKQRNLPRIAGHRAGAMTVDAIVTECTKLGIEVLTLYSFSSENWKRPPEEVAALMSLLTEYLEKERQRLIENNIRFRQIGRTEGLADDVIARIRDTEQATAHCTGLTLCLALNYGSRTEIADAVRCIVQRVQRGDLPAEAIDEQTISDHLYTRGLPDPDLLIRTAGEMRISNYLLWQISYAELYVTPTNWPDFSADHLRGALREFAARDRRYGGLASNGSNRVNGAQEKAAPQADERGGARPD